MLINPFSVNVATRFMDPSVNMVLAAEIAFDSGTTRVHTGTGTIEIDGKVFLGVGILGQIDTFKEQNSSSPTQVNLTLAGLDASMISIMLNENCVGKLASLYIGVLDDNFILTDADVVFRGKIRNTAVIGGEASAINLTLSNIFEDWARAKNSRYTDQYQRKVNNDDRIFRYVSQMADRSIFWGSKKDAPAFIYK